MEFHSVKRGQGNIPLMTTYHPPSADESGLLRIEQHSGSTEDGKDTKRTLDNIAKYRGERHLCLQRHCLKNETNVQGDVDKVLCFSPKKNQLLVQWPGESSRGWHSITLNVSGTERERERERHGERNQHALASDETVSVNRLPEVDTVENESCNVAAVTELIQQHKDYLHKQNQEIRVTGENRRIWRFPLGESRINATIVASLDEQEQAGGALRSRCTEGGEFWRQAEGHLEEIPLDRLLGKHCEETRLSGTTLIVGPCGFGKSTVIQKIIHDWAAGQLYQEINVIFPFKVQQLNSIDGQTCLNDLVVDFFPHFTNWLQFLWKEPEKILFIFDDLHLLQKTIDLSQPPSGNDDESQSLGPEEFCEISHIVRCLINGQLLTGCSVLGASSPWKLQSLGNAGSHRAVDILGLGADSMKQYFRQHAAAGQPASDVLDYIEEDEALRTMYHNPRFCSVLCSMLKEGSPTPAATTRTMILLTYLTCLLNKCCYEDIIAHHMLLKLGSLAYWGICTKTVVFERANSSSASSLYPIGSLHL
ncbi:NACHT, LRR and PYD domains-containing protein 3-like [Stegostoma tigrinum]|uniref:NACHT, LRR and PYD domains-containing protein 3-like n=1 Tax=Stegostoma tigrinum TaxID=3053191 RepID=UPI00286FBC11|nr:NACHT, LRR and PYD domains-containing protein 3-like [Stegostoma tigrinum]